jgi:4-hydroxythreonine-4-phosphate dehydrogenase
LNGSNSLKRQQLLNIMTNPKPIIITSGDPAGCGPYITLKAISELKKSSVDFFVVGDSFIYEPYPLYKQIKQRINFVDVKTPGISSLKRGVLSKLSGRASLNYLKAGLDLSKTLNIKRMVTAPLSKEAVKLNLSYFCGHTEFLADYFKAPRVAMLMASARLNVAIITRHIMLKEVSANISKKNIVDTISLVYDFFKKQRGLKKPKIAISAVNPHSSKKTFIGSEEKKILSAIKVFKFKVHGPYPADTLFTLDKYKLYDCIVCSYHDQAMIPFKLLSFCDGVNVTLGLPIVRTSPVHGVAYDLIEQKKKPDHSSMKAAINWALSTSVI